MFQPDQASKHFIVLLNKIFFTVFISGSFCCKARL